MLEYEEKERYKKFQVFGSSTASSKGGVRE